MGTIYGGLGDDRTDRVYRIRDLIRRIGGAFRAQRREMALAAGMMVLYAALSAAAPLLVTRSIDLVATATTRTARTSLWLALAIFAAGALGWGVSALQGIAATRATTRVVYQLRLDTYSALLGHDLSFYDRSAVGALVSRVTSDTYDFARMTSLVMNLTSQLVLMALLLIALSIIRWQLALLVVALAPVVVGVSLALRALARPAAVQEKRMRAALRASVSESLSGIATIQSYHQERAVFARFREINQLAYRADLVRGLVMENLFPSLAALEALVVAVMVYAGGLSAIRGAISAGTWYLFVQALQMYVLPLVGVASFWSQFQDGLSAAERVFALIDAEPRVIQ
ncbi:MAG: ABC transporter ATP-binding protein, partial [Anaerolineae bacterium]|nr:ABC transporter ATP-binding protein [Anaerolineae bacterium]